MAKTNKTSKTSTRTVIVLSTDGKAELRKLIKEKCAGIVNAKSAACLAIAQQCAGMFPDVSEKEYRRIKTAVAKFLRTDAAIKAATADAFGSQWNRYATWTAFACVAMVAHPGRTFDQFRANAAPAKGSKAAANLGQFIVDGDGKRDARADNGKAKGTDGDAGDKATRQPRTPDEAKLRAPDADQHPDAGDLVQINARRVGDAFIDHARELGALAALLADDVPDPAALVKAARKLSKTGGHLLAEWDALREHGGTRYELVTGNAAPVRNLM